MSILLVFKLIPDLWGQVLTEKGLCAFREDWTASQILRLLEMRTSLNFLLSSLLSRGSTTSKLLFFGNHGLYTIVHVLDKVDLRSAKSPLVGDIISVVRRFRVLTMDSSDLDMVLVGDGLELLHALTKFGKLNVDRSSESSSKISWA